MLATQPLCEEPGAAASPPAPPLRSAAMRYADTVATVGSWSEFRAIALWTIFASDLPSTALTAPGCRPRAISTLSPSSSAPSTRLGPVARRSSGTASGLSWLAHSLCRHPSRVVRFGVWIAPEPAT